MLFPAVCWTSLVTTVLTCAIRRTVAEELFSTAAMLGIKALDIVDRNSLAGMVRPANRSGRSKQKRFGLRSHSGPANTDRKAASSVRIVNAVLRL